MSRGGQRQVTIFAYLNSVDPKNGGQTIFPNIGLNVTAVKNKAAFWFDVDTNGNDDPRTLHAAALVINDVKFGLNIWIRQKEFIL